MNRLTQILAIILFVSHQAFSEVLIDLCTSKVYCQGNLLDVVQKSRVFNDSKTFVDLVQKYPENVTLDRFNKLMVSTKNRPTKINITRFINDCFSSEGELVNWTPPDYKQNASFLNKINDTEVKSFAKKLNNIWPLLARKVNNTVSKHPAQHSLISLPNGFIIPGGRFKEIYYWDSYWIVKGLLICGMNETARGVLENLISLVRRYGFVPNGSRVYYLNRSQPPLLSLMVGLYYDATKNITFIKKNIDILDQEVNWWLQNRAVKVRKDSIIHTLLQYSVKSGLPRPESYVEDLHTCEEFVNNSKVECYKNIRSAAESGWDFSSRWIRNSTGGIGVNLTDIHTSDILPVDLNAFICGAFDQLAKFYTLVGNKTKSTDYKLKVDKWKIAIDKIFYHKRDGIWYDVDAKVGRYRVGFYPSSFAPLWAKCFAPARADYYGSRAADYLNRNKLSNFLGGVPTSLIQSGQQWDLPNAWPPLQEIFVLGLDETRNKKAKTIANLFSKRILRAFMIGMNTTNEMFEKYDAINVGQYGGGGEYTVQSGFGWTNGVAFSLIQRDYLH
ncbi:trehalase-like [Diabrotica undecimpunctata]|uniref:trehalase-like n=1 Tax=Diabrotica undecimpunctata TaxID=50387 RepID=UPI003B6378B0